MTESEFDHIKDMYKNYLLSTSKHDRLVCDNCGYLYSHPLNYCVKCPGKIVSVKPLIIGEIDKLFKQEKMISHFFGGFSEYYEEKTGKPFPYEVTEYPSDYYYELSKILRELLKEI